MARGFGLMMGLVLMAGQPQLPMGPRVTGCAPGA